MWQAGVTLSRGVQASHCGGFSCCRAQALGTHRLQWLWHVGSIVIVRRKAALRHMGSSWSRARTLLPGAGSFFTTAPPGKPIFHCIYVPHLLWGFVGGAVVKYLPAKAEEPRDAVSITGSRRSLEKGMATHSRILAWKIPRTEEPGGLQTMALHSQTRLSVHTHTHTTSSLSIHLSMDI